MRYELLCPLLFRDINLFFDTLWYQSGAVDSLQGKQNISDESTNGNLNSNTEQMVDTPKKDDEKQGDSPQEGEQRVDTPRRDSEHRLDTPETTIKLEEQLEEIKLDW